MSEFLPKDRNFLGLDPADAHPGTAGVVVLPVPFEETSSYGQGSNEGPDAILEASQEVELFDSVVGFEPYQAAGGVATRMPLEVTGLDGAAVAERLYGETKHWLAQNKMIVTLGGEHTSVVGAIRAHCERFDDLTVLQLDAHSDLRPAYLGSPWNHACAMARVLDFHGHIVQVGIRSQAKEEREIAGEKGLPVFYAHDIQQSRGNRPPWIQQVIDATRPNVYITLDCDAFDPSIIPATGTPEPGGLDWRQVDGLLARLCVERNVVGIDISELAPIPGIQHPQFTMAKLVYRLIGYRFLG
jgi:agmatinase